MILETDLPKLPVYVYADKDRHGRLRYRCRKKGLKSTTIKAHPKSRDFRLTYDAFLGGEEPPKSNKNSFEWLVNEYLFALEMLVKNGHASIGTLKQRRLQLKTISKEHGHRDAFKMTPKAVRNIISKYAHTPAKANNVLKSIRAMYRWAINAGKTETDNSTTGVEGIKYKTDGFIPWSTVELRQFIKKYPIGTLPYLAAMMVLCVGARRGDACLLGPQNTRKIENVRCIEFTQDKTGGLVTVPILPILQEAMDAMEIKNARAYIPNSYGRPYTKESFGNWFSKRVKEAGLKNRSLHGLRKSQGAILAEMGCTQYEIMSIQGHADPKSSEIYTRTADRIKLALSAMDRVVDFKV